MLILALLGGFWQISRIEAAKEPVQIKTMPLTAFEQAQIEKVIASKTGHSYYYSFCGALNRVRPENRVVFANAAAARAKGYVPAKNCKGVE